MKQTKRLLLVVFLSGTTKQEFSNFFCLWTTVTDWMDLAARNCCRWNPQLTLWSRNSARISAKPTTKYHVVVGINGWPYDFGILQYAAHLTTKNCHISDRRLFLTGWGNHLQKWRKGKMFDPKRIHVKRHLKKKKSKTKHFTHMNYIIH